MKTGLLILLNIFFASTSFAGAKYYYAHPDKSYQETPGSKFLVTQSSPVRSQDDLGVCYSFSSASLLETFRCKELNLDCNNPRERLSTFDIASYAHPTRSIEEGGNPTVLLSKLAQGNRLVAREECAPFSSLIHQIKDNNKIKKDQKVGWDLLINKWNEYKSSVKNGSPDCIECQSKSLKSTLLQLGTSAEQLNEAFKNASNESEFIYQAIMPKECLEEKNAAIIPPFEMNSYPRDDEKFEDEKLRTHIESLLSSGTPVEISYCTESIYRPNCQKGHSAPLYGIKELCSKSGDCKTMVKMKNSNGMSWQNMHNDGWIELEPLIKSSGAFTQNLNITWISKPDEKFPENKFIKRNK